MIALCVAILRSFASDRASLALAFMAPIAFFSLFALFFRHLDDPNGMQIQVAVSLRSEDPIAARLADAFVAQSGGRISVSILPPDTGADGRAARSAIVEIPRDFDAANPSVVVESLLPLPGAADAVKQLVAAGNGALAAEQTGAGTPRLEVRDRTRHGTLMRASAPGIPILFILVALSSLAARGIGDDEAGLSDRLRSLRVSALARTLSRFLALGIIATAQLGTTLLFAAIVFGLVPASPLRLAVATIGCAAACAAFIVLLVELCGNRARFASIAPVCTLTVAGLGGSMVPVALLPPSLAWPASWTFTGWSIEACVHAIDGDTVLRPLLLLACFTAACAACAALLRRRRALR